MHRREHYAVGRRALPLQGVEDGGAVEPGEIHVQQQQGASSLHVQRQQLAQRLATIAIRQEPIGPRLQSILEQFGERRIVFYEDHLRDRRSDLDGLRFGIRLGDRLRLDGWRGEDRLRRRRRQRCYSRWLRRG